MESREVLETSPIAQVPDSTIPMILDGLAAGSWAIVVVIGLLYLTLSKHILAYIDRQVHLLGTLERTLEQNTETLKTMAQTDNITATMLKEMRLTNTREHQALWKGIQDLRKDVAENFYRSEK